MPSYVTQERALVRQVLVKVQGQGQGTGKKYERGEVGEQGGTSPSIIHFSPHPLTLPFLLMQGAR